ncbi:MAG: hypothetical protein JWR69_2857 [Pedosphaera sp.]|nr:hypothetical protein [Pedosphaera sp.]
MTSTESVASTTVPVEEIQKGWHELTLRVGQLETERSALEQDNKALRSLLERAIEHRQKSHGELVLLLTGLVGKLPINDVAVVVSKLVEHNAHVSATCAALAKGKTEAAMPQLSVLKALDQTKRDLVAALKPAVDELIQLEAPLETNMLRSLVTDPESFFAPAVVRANRCFAKGQVPRERIAREFGTEALIFFNDLTTDPKLNPRPKPEEIVLGFKSDFEALFQQNPALIPDQRQELLALHQKVQRSKAATEQARLQKNAFQKISFILELLHYYENQSTEAPDVVFAQRLPGLVEQLVVTGPQDNLDEKALVQAESLLAFVINPDHRLMTINNMGKNGGTAKTLKYTLKLRTPQLPDQNEALSEFVRHLIPAAAKILPQPPILATTLRLLPPDIQRLMVGCIMSFEKLRRDEANALGRSVAKELGLSGLDEIAKAAAPAVPVEMERQMAWEKVKELIKQRGEPAVVAAAIRDRLHAKYDGDEIKESWLTLIQTDPMSLIRTFCHLPYLADGRTDPIARTVMETYISRLTHEKYAATYIKVVNSLKNMFQAKPDSPTLINFLALVKWVDPEAAAKLSTEIGMPPTH